MRHCILGIALCLLTAAPAFALNGGAELELKGEEVYITGTDAALPRDVFQPQSVTDTGMFFLGVGENDGEEHGVAHGLYIFTELGKLVAFAPTPDAEFCAEVRLSPAWDAIAMDAGTSPERSWSFFSFPKMKALGRTAYYRVEDKSSLIWTSDTGVLVSSIDSGETLGRTCDYDPCGPVSVAYFSLDSGESSTVKVGTALCDYRLAGFDADAKLVNVDALCMRSVKEWHAYPVGAPVKRVTAPLP